jgi:hypothetical protein
MLRTKEVTRMSVLSAAPPRPEPLVRRHGFLFSALIWLGLVAYLALAKALLDAFLPHAFASDEQRAAFAWPTIGLVAALGLVGAWLAHRTGFPAAWGTGAQAYFFRREGFVASIAVRLALYLVWHVLYVH